MDLDEIIQLGLRERWLVGLVMTVSSIADEIDEKILMEAMPVGNREADHLDARFGVVGVHMYDGNLEALREIARVVRRPPLLRVGGESDLIVGNDVQRPADPISLEHR